MKVSSWRATSMTTEEFFTICVYWVVMGGIIALAAWGRSTRQKLRHRDSPSASAASDCPEGMRSEEHTSELQSLMRISYAVFCLKTQHNLTVPFVANHKE